MANQEHVEMLTNWTADRWNKWMQQHPGDWLDVSGQAVGIQRKINGHKTKDDLADFRGFDLRRVNMNGSGFHESDLSCADMSGRIYKKLLLPKTKMHRTNLGGSEMQDCTMALVDLTAANLTKTKFTDSMLMNACFSNATLHLTDFRRADLTGADFSDCDLRFASLAGASLACSRVFLASKLNGAMNWSDFLAGVRDEFDGSYDAYISWKRGVEESIIRQDVGDDELRRYVRYEGWRNNPFPQVLGTVASVQGLLKLLDRFRSMYETPFISGDVRHYYRGEESNRWCLTPSLYRKVADRSESELAPELMTRVPDRFGDAESPFDHLVVAQQYGLPTRLLDVTRNPLVALYFAVQRGESYESSQTDIIARIHVFVSPSDNVRRHDDDAVNIAAAFSKLTWMEQDVILTRCFEWDEETWTEPETLHDDHGLPVYADVVRRIVELVAPTRPYMADRFDPKDLFRVFVVEPRRSFPRIGAQAGAFLISAFHRRFEEDEIRGVDASAHIYDHSTIQVDVSGERRANMLKQLDYLNINEETMFPGLESAAKAIAEQHAKPSPN